MNQHERVNFGQLIALQPLLKDEERDRITILISGKQFIVQNRHLRIFPDTLLGNENERRIFYDKQLNMYRFNRHPTVFESVLYYYLSPGILIRPPQIEPEIFYEELRFWGINESLLETFIEEEMFPLENIRLLPAQKWRRIIWKMLTYPKSVRLFYFMVTLMSCFPFGAEILPTVSELARLQALLDTRQIYLPLYMREFYMIEMFCISIFTIEFILRIISAPNFSAIQYDTLNFLDLTNIVSGSLCLICWHLHNIGKIENFLSFYGWLIILKSFRLFRVARQMTHLRLLYKAVAMCLNELCTLIILVIFCMLFFGILIYIVDNSEPESNTRNILDGLWLAFITLTTLGYGDIYPRSLGARLIAALCALTGIIAFSMPSAIVFVKYGALLKNRWKEHRNIRYRISS